MLTGQLHGILSGASAVYGVTARDEFFGIENEKRKVQLNSIINNVVYRLEDAPPNAASQVLAKWRRQIAADWEHLYQVKVAGFETFVIEGSLNDREEVCTDRTRPGHCIEQTTGTCLALPLVTQKSTRSRQWRARGGAQAKASLQEIDFCPQGQRRSAC